MQGAGSILVGVIPQVSSEHLTEHHVRSRDRTGHSACHIACESGDGLRSSLPEPLLPLLGEGLQDPLKVNTHA